MNRMRNPIKSIQAWILNRQQAELTNKYEKFGLTDEILDKQIEINEKRHKLDIPDKDNFVYEEFVQ